MTETKGPSVPARESCNIGIMGDVEPSEESPEPQSRQAEMAPRATDTRVPFPLGVTLYTRQAVAQMFGVQPKTIANDTTDHADRLTSPALYRRDPHGRLHRVYREEDLVVFQNIYYLVARDIPALRAQRALARAIRDRLAAERV